MRIARVLCLALPTLLACDSVPAGEESTEETTGETGDGGEPPLFDESGVWAVERYSLDGGQYVEISANRADRFLLRFKPSDGVLAAAACTEQGTEININGSNCTNGALSSWSCQCFAYSFEGDQMAWKAFTPVPGEPPPVVDGGSHLLIVEEAGDGPYVFRSLPEELFNSDGVVSQHAFSSRADAVWTDVDLNMDAVPDLEACSRSCFPSEAGG